MSVQFSLSKVALALSLLVSIPSFADYLSQDTNTNTTTPKVTTSKSDQPQIRGLASARPEVKDGVDLFLTGDLLIWKTQIDGLSYASEYTIEANNDQTSLQLLNGKTNNPHFNYQYGFKAALGCNLSHDGWDAILSWTWFRDESKSHAQAKDNYALFPSLLMSAFNVGSFLTTASEADFKWDLHFDMLDLEMGREFYAGKWLALRPFFGLRSAWIDQNNKAMYYGISILTEPPSTFTYADTKMINDFWGFGPRIGLNGEWQFGSGWSLYGNAGLSLLYGYFHIHEKTISVDSTAVTSELFNTGNSFHSIKPAIDLEVGLQWDYMFFHDSFHLGLHAGWQQQLFFSQNQIMHYSNLFQPSQFFQNQGDLGFQGWSIGARFDF